MTKPTSNVPSQGNASLDGGQFLSELLAGRLTPVRVGQLFQKVIGYMNGLASSAANSGSGEIAPPPPLNSLTVKTSGEQVHVQISHPGAIQRGVQYFTEVGVNDPGFTQPIVIDHGASRTSHPFVLPTNDDAGVANKFYLRAYAQYHGSKRSGYAYWGQPQAPTAVVLGGTTNMTPLSSNGSGTASNAGTQGGEGLGNNLFRPGAAPKRATGSL